MKKIYLLATALSAGLALKSQTAFFSPVNYRGAFPVTDGNTGISSNDWTAGWTNWDPENAVYPSTTVTVSSDITTNTTWTTGQVVLLQNKVYVKSGATLTIQPGVIVRGDYATQGALVVTRGAKIVAQGTSTNPIIFTSNNAVGNRAEGDWGGVVILGNGIVNQPGGIANIEGITPSADTQYGGNDDADSSGVFSYVRIEFPGIPLQPNKEINGLTLGAVGSRTKLDHIQVSFSGDDAFEWFGGAARAKYLISFRSLDDDFDTDFAYKGYVQFGLMVRDKDMSDAAGDSNGFESDNEGTAPYLSRPLTSAIFSNVTSIGPKGDGTVALPAGEKFERGVYIRRNSALSVFNSVIVGWEKGLHVKDAVTADNFTTNDTAVFGNNLISADVAAKFVIDAASNATAPFYSTIYSNDGNDSTKTVNQVAFVNAFPANHSDAHDFRLQASSVVSGGASFTDPKFTGLVIGINKPDLNQAAFRLFPNPANDNTKVVLNMVKETNCTVMMYNVTGELAAVLANNVKVNGEYVINVNTSAYTNGIYFIQFQSGHEVKTAKLIINNK